MNIEQKEFASKPSVVPLILSKYSHHSHRFLRPIFSLRLDVELEHGWDTVCILGSWMFREIRYQV